jgi:hypothetical protein
MTVDHKATRRRAGGRPRRGDHGPAAHFLQGECVEVMAGLEETSVDAVVTDPPYGIDWQGESWDGRAIREAAARAAHRRLSANEAFEVWCRIWGEACLGVMKPGAHLLAFCSPRTWHRLTAGLEDAGFEIRDTLMWLYGSGMPKTRRYPGDRASALKPAFEPVVLARKPTVGTLAENVARHGTGLLETGAGRVEGRHPADVAIGHGEGCGEGGARRAVRWRRATRLRDRNSRRVASCIARRPTARSATPAARGCPSAIWISSPTPAPRGRRVTHIHR